MPYALLVHNLATATDRNGNRSHAFTITNLAGQSVTCRDAGGDRNAVFILRNMGLDSSQIYVTSATVGKRDLPKTGLLEYEIRDRVWKLLPLDLAIPRLAAWIADEIHTIEQGVNAENDGRLDEYRRYVAENNARIARENLERLAKTHGIAVQWPGVFPLFTWAAGSQTVGRGPDLPLAGRVLA